MAKITADTTIEDLAGIVSSALNAAGISAVLSGGAVVSIYSRNAYESGDLDFVTHAGIKELIPVMETLGFRYDGRLFVHPRTKLFVEFPPAPAAIGKQILPQEDWVAYSTKHGVVVLLSPTDCVRDRLSGFYHWNDKQNLEQALLVAVRHPVDMAKIREWSESEGAIEKFRQFEKNLIAKGKLKL